MNFRNQKGFTGIDMIIGMITLFIFATIISVLTYNYSQDIREMELKTEAIYYAITEIESEKGKEFKEVVDQEQTEILDEEGKPTGFSMTKTTQDYRDIALAESVVANSDVVKRITVTISYLHEGEVQTVELSTGIANYE